MHLHRVEEFFGSLREALSDCRRKVVEAAFHSFDLDDLGKVYLRTTYDFSRTLSALPPSNALPVTHKRWL